MSSSLGGGGGGRDYGHIRFALSTITGIFAASSGKGEIYTAGRRRGRAGGWLCLPLPGEDEPEKKKGKLDVMCLQSWVGGDGDGRGAAGQAGMWGEHAGSHLEPFLSSSQHHLRSRRALPNLPASPFSQKKEKQSKAMCCAQALPVPWAGAELERGQGMCPPESPSPSIAHPGRPFEPGQEFKPPS